MVQAFQNIGTFKANRGIQKAKALKDAANSQGKSALSLPARVMPKESILSSAKKIQRNPKEGRFGKIMRECFFGSLAEVAEECI
jgi:hypothetical protein